MSVSWVRQKVREVINKIKEERLKRPYSSINQTAITRRKKFRMKSNIKSRKSENNFGIENTIVSKKVNIRKVSI